MNLTTAIIIYLARCFICLRTFESVQMPNQTSACSYCICFSVEQKMCSSSEKLYELGYKREAVECMKDHAAILIRLARALTFVQDKHELYLKVCANVMLV